LETEVIKRLTALLDHKNSEIRRLSALNLASISFSERGKIKVILKNINILIFII